jgi:hypothetical protein
MILPRMCAPDLRLASYHDPLRAGLIWVKRNPTGVC